MSKSSISNGYLLDSRCRKTGMIVINPSDKKDVYSCTLNQTQLRANANKFYIIQLIKTTSDYTLFTRWGRIGDDGQTQYKSYPTESGGIIAFKNQFKTKTRNNWDKRDNFVKKSGKYFLTETSYEDELKDIKDTPVKDIPKSVLVDRIQTLIKLISDIDMMKKTMIELDIDTKKLPLGKLKKSQLDKALKVLEKINNSLKDKTKSKVDLENEIEELSSEYYTYIPFVCGRRRPPLINDDTIVTKLTNTVEDLKNITINVKITQGMTGNTNPVDCVYNNLNTQMKPVGKTTKAWNCINKFFTNTHAPTHNFKLQLIDVLEVTRNGNYDVYNDYAKKLGNRQLLIHGSRMCNWVSILKNNLMLDPSKMGAHISGKMFGYGVYFANSFSKSAQYCGVPYGGSGTICFALAEVAMGNECEKLNSDYYVSKTKLEKTGHNSTWGIGNMTPSEYEFLGKNKIKVPVGKLVKSNRNSVLRYDEKIVYDSNQFCVKFMVIAHMSYK